MFDLIKKNINYKNGVIFFIFTSLSIFLINNLKKNKPIDISEFVVPVERGLLSESINSSGEIKASRSLKISPRKQGFIKSIKVNEGDLVKKNQILATLDNLDFKYKIKEFELQAEKQKSDFKRREYLYNEGAISKQDLEDYRIKYNSSKARLNDAAAESSFYKIKAPFDGKITAKYVEIGSYVTPSASISSNPSSKNYIFELSDGIEIIAKVPESDIGRIKLGQEALIRIEAYPSRKFKAEIIEIASRASKDNNVTSFEVTLKFRDNVEDVKIGMTTDLEFKITDSDEKILIPTVSIVTEKGKKGILIVGKNNNPKFKEIELGISSGSKTSVLEGLKEGDLIFLDIPPWSKRNK
tara:strand:+ start:48 stop:1109 length:1062 start_codon:yes stop_codon:yes gene_type:complete